MLFFTTWEKRENIDPQIAEIIDQKNHSGSFIQITDHRNIVGNQFNEPGPDIKQVEKGNDPRKVVKKFIQDWFTSMAKVKLMKQEISFMASMGDMPYLSWDTMPRCSSHALQITLYCHFWAARKIVKSLFLRLAVKKLLMVFFILWLIRLSFTKVYQMKM